MALAKEEYPKIPLPATLKTSQNKVHQHMDQYRKGMNLLQQVQRGARKISRWLEHLSYKDKLGELGLFSPEKRRIQGELIVAFLQGAV